MYNYIVTLWYTGHENCVYKYLQIFTDICRYGMIRPVIRSKAVQYQERNGMESMLIILIGGVVLIAVIIAVVASVTGAVAGISDEEDGEE